MEVVSISKESMAEGNDWAKEKEEFDKTKAGVKGLIDSGGVKIPGFFIHPRENLQKSSLSDACGSHLKIPMIDLEGFERNGQRRKEIVDELRKAAETWGCFQMVNHGIPDSIMKEMIDGARQFHEQPTEAKMELYSRDPKQNVMYYGGDFQVVSRTLSWRDSLHCRFNDGIVDPNVLPLACRNEVEEYMKCMIKLKAKLCELLSEALGLSSDYLADIECMKSATLLCNYYPVCPEPDLILGFKKHQDVPFLTILLQDSIGGLQFIHQNHWVDVPTVQGALLVNIGDLMQLSTNDKFKSAEHRVLAGSIAPRISVACFFFPSTRNVSKPYGPIKELLSHSNPPIYRGVLFREAIDLMGRLHGPDGSQASVLPHFKL